MTGITSWEILRPLSPVPLSSPRSLRTSFISVSFRSRCSACRQDEYRWAQREYRSFARCSSFSPSSEIRGSHVTLHRPDLDKKRMLKAPWGTHGGNAPREGAKETATTLIFETLCDATGFLLNTDLFSTLYWINMCNLWKLQIYQFTVYGALLYRH